MPDEITPEERAAIDSAIAAGKARKIPAGQSAMQLVENPDTGKMVWINVETGEANAQRRFGFGRVMGSREKAIKARRDKVRAAHAKGMTNWEISKELGVVVECVEADLSAMGLRANVRLGGRISPEERAARRNEVVAMMRQGRRQVVIARKLGVSESTVSADIEALRKAGRL